VRLADENTSKYQKAALGFRTLGWLSIAWSCITVLWLWMGLRAGSNLWLWWTIGQFVFGAICVGVANRLQARAAHLPEMETRDRAA
jgi:bacteriorhodopsin